MKSIPPLPRLTLTLFCLTLITVSRAVAAQGPDLKSAGPIAFGPDGTLFVADPKAATIVAIPLKKDKATGADSIFKLEKINHKLAGLLGAAPDSILINDLAVHPLSRNAYLSVSRGRGPDSKPVLVRAQSTGKLEILDLAKHSYTSAVLPDAPKDEVQGEGRRRRNPRMESITDLAFMDGRVIIAGLANEEFASSLRAVSYPFAKSTAGTVVEIYHGAHGRYETRSPVRTFLPFSVDGKPTLLAAYTCTPLVQFPLSELKPKAKIRGTTVAELGNRNRPLDMIAYRKDGKDYLLIANSSRGIMKVSTDTLGKAEGIVERVARGKTAGLAYETIKDWQGVSQLDLHHPSHALVVRQEEEGSLNLESLPLP